MMQLIRLLTYYAPVAFFAIFAGLVADYGPKIAGPTAGPWRCITPCASCISSPSFP